MPSGPSGLAAVGVESRFSTPYAADCYGKIAMPILPLFDEPFLRAHWEADFLAFRNSPEAGDLLARLRA